MQEKFAPTDVKDIFRITLLTIAILFVIGLLSTACTDKCEVDRQYTYYKAVYTTTEEIRAAVSMEAPHNINQPGKIYFKDGILFINEVGKGVHLVDNSNAALPRQLGFVNIPGNFDIAARGNYLYADSYVDLLVFDISDIQNVREIYRVEGAFKEFANLPFFFDPWSSIITTYELASVDEVAEVECESGNVLFLESGRALTNDAAVRFDFVATSGADYAPSPAAAPDAGIGGSMARFSIYDDFLYTIDASSLYLFDISALDRPKPGAHIQVGWGIETLFSYGDKLFIGANNGMHIYDNANPQAPVHLSTYAHIQSCDPVVVQDNYAYVTLRSGNECQGFTNQLEIVDISDPGNPTLFKTYPMQHPHGLGVDGNCLFICEGEFGLKVFDKNRPHEN